MSKRKTPVAEKVEPKVEPAAVATIARTRKEIVADMCAQIGSGASVSAICRGDGDYPCAQVFWRWLQADKELITLYEAALAMRAHVYAEELIGIADDSAKDVVQTDNGPRVDAEVVARAKLRVNTRQWIMSRLLPKKYGDKLDIEHSGGLKVVQINDADASIL